MKLTFLVHELVMLVGVNVVIAICYPSVYL